MNGSGWARNAVILISIVNLVVILMPGGYGSGDFWNAVLSVVMIVYMMSSGIKAWFANR